MDLDVSRAEFSSYDVERELFLPKKITPLLAEEVGMHIGDGFLSASKFDYRLKGGKDEKDFYDGFVKQTYKTLFNADVKIREFEASYGFEYYSKALWTFKSRVLGIQLSPKTDIRIPELFKVSDQAVLCSFLRGYFDTDGCLVAYSRYGREHYYPMITVASASKPLTLDVLEILRMLGFSCCYSENFGKWISFQIQLYGYANFQRYCDLIGWNNPKYVRKAQLLKERIQTLSVAQVV